MNDFVIPDRRGLVAEYLLNGSSVDTSGNGYNGTASNVTYSNTGRGYQTYAGNFNGSSSKVDLPSFVSMGDFTINAVINGSSSFYGNVVVLQTSAANANLECSFHDTTRRLRIITWNGSAANVVLSDDVLDVDKTYFVTFQRIGGVGTIHINGSVVKSGTLHTFATSTDLCAIGYSRGGNTGFISSKIQSVRIFNRALSETEIRNWYLESLRSLGGSTLADLMSGVVAYYDMRGDADDIAGGFDGTVNGATLTTDRFGNPNSGYSFNGSSHIGIASSSALQLVSNYTIIVDVEAGTNPGEDTCIVGKDSNTGERAYYLASNAAPVGGSNRFTFYINGAGGGYVNSTTTITTGNKYVVAGTHTGSQLKIYVNGTYEAAASAASTNTGNSELQIGARQYSGARQFYNGKIYRVLIFNVLKTDAEIATITKLLQNGILLPFA